MPLTPCSSSSVLSDNNVILDRYTSMRNEALTKKDRTDGLRRWDALVSSLTRITNSQVVPGNKVLLLKDAEENYPAWLEAIDTAKHYIYFESYIIHDDEQGLKFGDALISKANDGVPVKLIYDWMGGFGKTSRKYWNWLRRNGVDVRCYNPPKLTDPLGFFSRDHRKCLVVDGEVAFVSGLCVGRDWVGDASRNVAPWRDTGVEIRGPAVAEVEDAFAAVWSAIGGPLEASEHRNSRNLDRAGEVCLRVIKSAPSMGSVYRVDNILASLASKTMWLTDAYFVGVPAYMQSLKDASRDGVDVRLLLPQTSDIGLIRDTTRSTYRPLLEAGVRVYEWNGPMIHAKTAVFDGRYSRVGSTNLNIASWFGNYELDVLIEDKPFGEQMQSMFLEDIENATEIVLEDTARRKIRRKPGTPRIKRGAGSVRKATAGALNAATSISSAIANKERLGPAESRLLAITGIALLFLALLFIFFPRIASIPLVILLLSLAIPTLIKAIQNYRNN